MGFQDPDKDIEQGTLLKTRSVRTRSANDGVKFRGIDALDIAWSRKETVQS